MIRKSLILAVLGRRPETIPCGENNRTSAPAKRLANVSSGPPLSSIGRICGVNHARISRGRPVIAPPVRPWRGAALRNYSQPIKRASYSAMTRFFTPGVNAGGSEPGRSRKRSHPQPAARRQPIRTIHGVRAPLQTIAANFRLTLGFHPVKMIPGVLGSERSEP